MAQQDIRYGGYATTPNDRDCPDGPLATSINLINEDGALQPLIEPEDVFTLPAGYKLWCIHATAVFKHYIVETDEHELAWIDENNTSNVEPIDNYSATTIHQVTTVGNTLCLLDNNGLNYILWQADINGYTYLGQEPEMIELSFGLSDNKLADYIGNQYGNSRGVTNYALCYTSQFYAQSCTLDDAQKKININLPDSQSDSLLEELWATINKANAFISKQGHFYAPFFVRYAYRLYDGKTLWMHSAPVFLPVSMPIGYNVDILQAVVDANDDISINVDHPEDTLDLTYFPQNVALTCKAISGDIYRLKNEWGDIIKSIDIFVSLPMIREKSNEKIRSATLAGWSPNIYTVPDRPKTRHLRDGDLWIQNGEVIANGTSSGARKRVFIDIPLLSMERYQEKICDVSNFYKVASYNLANDTIPTTSYEEVNIGEDVLTALATQEVMTDDYKTHNQITPIFNGTECITHLFNNNKRLIVTAPQERLFDGFPACSLVPYCGDNITIKKIFVRLKTEVGERVVEWSYDTGYLSNRVISFCQPLFYPDNRAFEIDVYFTYINELQHVAYGKYVRTMNPCAMLNGSFTNVGDYVTISYPSQWGTLPTTSYLVPYPYKLYSSDVNNPFIFPSTGINSVGSGSITGIATVNEPVSTGQFGYSDIYIFTTDGLWVAKIGSDGGLTSIQPVKADVCISPESITQLSGSVLFATARGIMEVVGNQTVCISDILNGDLPVNLSNDLPHADELHQLLGHSDTSCLNPAPFLEYVQGCRMIYDYTHQRIVVFNPTIEDGERKYTYAYVYSLKSKLWGMMYSDLSYGFNSYPDAMAVDDSNNVVTLSSSETVFNKQMFITRPMKLGATDTIKTIRDLIQRGVFDRGDVNTVLYGSRDLINWHLIGSSTYHDLRNLRGTGYKYFRIASVTSLAKGESLSGVTIEAVPKHTNLLI